MKFKDLFPEEKPIIACIHLLALPGSPLYDGNMSRVYEQALSEAEIFKWQRTQALHSSLDGEIAVPQLF